MPVLLPEQRIPVDESGMIVGQMASIKDQKMIADAWGNFYITTA
jgi:hypothetical protein